MKHYVLNWFNCLIVCPFRANSGKYYSKRVEINAVLKIKESDYVGILSDQEEAVTASNLSEYIL